MKAGGRFVVSYRLPQALVAAKHLKKEKKEKENLWMKKLMLKEGGLRPIRAGSRLVVGCRIPHAHIPAKHLKKEQKEEDL